MSIFFHAEKIYFCAEKMYFYAEKKYFHALEEKLPGLVWTRASVLIEENSAWGMGELLYCSPVL